MQQITLTLTNEMGLHARPASELIKTACIYKSNITITGKNKTIDAKSIIKVLTMGLSKGDAIKLTAEGPDEIECIESLTRLIKNNFYEPTII